MDVLKDQRDQVGSERYDDQMDMVGHQAIAREREVVALRVFLKELPVDEAVGIGFEYYLACVASLGHVMRRIDRDDAGESGHTDVWWKKECGILRERSVCPPVSHGFAKAENRDGVVVK